MNYSAFISYNHNPRDIEVVKELQTKLEHFRIPKELQASTGRDKIGRVFLDIGELGVSADLNDDIKDALKNAEYLITICSPESRQSPWCRKEVEFFLTTHDMDKVLTVITDGEPKDVLPPEILSREEVAEDGTVTHIIREPLSCDYRGDRKKANKTELPRLVSAIIGCRYDDLIQRQKQYRTRRLIMSLSALTAVMVVALAYFIWSNVRIKENYNNTLREQSHALALKSSEALANGDRLGAVGYALEALPSEKKDRPVVADAVLALADATDIYKLPTEAGWTAIRRYDTYGSIRKITTADVDGRVILAELSINGRIALMDSDSGEELVTEYTKALSDEGLRVINTEFTDEGKLIIVTDNKVMLLDVGSGRELWAYNSDHTFLSSEYTDDVAITEDCVLLPSCRYSYDLSEMDYSIIKLDVKKGGLVDEIGVTGDIRGTAISSDGSSFAFFSKGEDKEPDHIYVMDTKSNKISVDVSKAFVTGIVFNSKGDLVACGIDTRPDDNDLSTADSVQMTGGGGTGIKLSISKNRNIEVVGIDPKSGSEIWSDSFNKTTRSLPRLRTVTESGSFMDDMLCIINNTASVYDSDGNRKNKIDFESGITDLFPTADDRLRVIQENGEISWFDNKEKTITTGYGIFIGPVEHVDVSQKDSVYIASVDESDSSKIAREGYVTQYRYEGYDKEWTAFEDQENGTDESSLGVDIIETSGDKAIRLSLGTDRKYKLKTWSLSDGKLAVDCEFDAYDADDEYSKYEYAGIDEESGSIVLLKSNRGYVFPGEDKKPDVVLKSADVNTGEETLKEYSYDESGNDSTSNYKVKQSSLINGSIFTVLIRENYIEDSYAIVVDEMDLSGDKIVQHEITEIEKADKESLSAKLALDASSSDFIFADHENRLNCFDISGRLLWQTETLPYTVEAVVLDIEGAAIAFEQDPYGVILHVYDVKTGEEKTEVTLDGAKIYTDAVAKNLPSDEILISFGSSAFILDEESYELRTRIAGTYRGFDSDTSEFILGSGVDNALGHVPYRSLGDMIELGKKLLK